VHDHWFGPFEDVVIGNPTDHPVVIVIEHRYVEPNYLDSD
jgi:hypothetical protein